MVSTDSLRNQLVLLPPNRVWRTYPGGATLEKLAGNTSPKDTHFPEDWIGSMTRAVNLGRESIEEGVSQVQLGEETHDFKALLESDPEYFLGADHVAKHGVSPMLLIKFLDSAIRLHFQCHPSNEFAHRVLNSPSGKTEAYHILSTREDVTEPFIYVGFQHPPSPEDLRRWIEEQDIASLEACFEKIPVKPGDTYFIPGGTPHALGEGIFMVEIQEPTDFAIRFEYERAGYVLPEAARFMGRDVDFGLSMVDLTAYSIETVAKKFGCAPSSRHAYSDASWQESLIGPDKTACFRVAQTHVADRFTKSDSSFSINIVTAGELQVQVAGQTHTLKTYDKFFTPAGISDLQFSPLTPSARILECFPPA